MFLTVVFYAFIVFTAIQIIYYLTFSSLFFKSKKTNKINTKPPISLLIFVKNSAAYLEKNLTYFLNQDYPEFEILLIDNCSSDDTDEVLEKIKTKHKKVRIINVENNESFWANKKYTYTLAIKAAKYNHLLFSEIIAKPISKNWILEMSNQISDKKSLVLGYTKHNTSKGFMNLLIRFNDVLDALKAFTFTKFNTPFRASAYNFSFTKDNFFRVNGFIKHIKINYGKDDLFLRDAYFKKNTSFSIDEDSFVEITKEKTFKDWFSAQKRNSFLQNHYKLNHQILLFLYTITKLGSLTLGITLLFFYPYKIILCIIGFYFLVKTIVLALATKKFKEPKIIFLFPFLEIILILLQISIFINNLMLKPNHWK